MSLLIKKAGILSTVQDRGRVGWRRLGVNPNGAMDPAAARIANMLVGNDENAALLEMHFPAGEIIIEEASTLAIAGCDFGAELDDEPLPAWRSFLAEMGSTLRFTQKRSGERCYLAVRGGINVPPWLGSASTNLNAQIGGRDGRRLHAGDRISIGKHDRGPARTIAASQSVLPRYSRFPTVRILPGAEFEYLDPKSRDLLLNQDHVISNRSDRMGFRLTAEPLRLAKPRELISAAVCFGTVQLLPDGQLIILMADQQTAGGYPRIAHVISNDLPLVGQLGAGDKVAFHLVDIDEAERLAMRSERELSFLRVACRLAYR